MRRCQWNLKPVNAITILHFPRHNFVLGRPDPSLMLPRVQHNALSIIHLDLKDKFAEYLGPSRIRKYSELLAVRTLGDASHHVQSSQARLLLELPGAAIQNRRVLVIDGTARELPLARHAVRRGALHEKNSPRGGME
ncbi:hypothetical protein CRV24_001795 [Beauveria bassiana]|nr:hypothetical protein CRV24_001795 [Beauveria bassiana]KAH8719578.1 hypothetical protein HC256_000014 [Beauveria bassiana]